MTVVGVTAQVPAQTSASDPLSWSRYTVKGEDLSIALPTLPALRTSKETRQLPQKDRQRCVLKSVSQGIVYQIHIVENPEPRLSLDKFIEEQTAANPADTLTSERNLTLDGIAGKALVYSDRKGMVQFFATEDRLYEFRATGASVDDARMAKFFSSLSLKKQKGSIEVSDVVQSFDTDAAENIYTGKDVENKVQVIKKPEPSYSGRAESDQTTGTVILRCVFAADGTVTRIRVIAGIPGLTERAIEAARKIKFKPATKDGLPVSMWMQLEYRFDASYFIR